MDLLAKSEEIIKLVQEPTGKTINLNILSHTLRDLFGANIYIISKKGKILGYGHVKRVNNNKVSCMVKRRKLTTEYADWLLTIDSTSVGFYNRNEFKSLHFDKDSNSVKEKSIIIPIISNGNRMGSLVIVRDSNIFTKEDLVLAEFSAALAGMEILRERKEIIRNQARKKAIIQIAFTSLSYSELEAIDCVFSDLKASEGAVVTSKVAGKIGITRSIIVNALRKLESAGIIKTRSLGMKGTYIKVLNDRFLVELEKYREQYKIL